jgi:hypothetical protein
MQYTVALFRKYCSQNYSKFMILYYLLDLSHWISIGRLKVDQIYDTVTTMHKYRRSKCDLRAKPTGNRGLPWRKIRIAGKMKQARFRAREKSSGNSCAGDKIKSREKPWSKIRTWTGQTRCSRILSWRSWEIKSFEPWSHWEDRIREKPDLASERKISSTNKM